MLGKLLNFLSYCFLTLKEDNTSTYLARKLYLLIKYIKCLALYMNPSGGIFIFFSRVGILQLNNENLHYYYRVLQPLKSI